MNKYSFTFNGQKWERVSKQQALKAYNKGLSVWLCPVNLTPFTVWHVEVEINKNSEQLADETFQNVVNQFEYYNCCDNNARHYTAFYMPVIEGEVALNEK